MSERDNPIQVSLSKRENTIPSTHLNHIHKYNIKIIHLHHDFMNTSFIYLNQNKCDQHRNFHIRTSIKMKNKHAYITQL